MDLQIASDILAGLLPLFVIVVGISLGLRLLITIMDEVKRLFPTNSTEYSLPAAALDEASEKPKRKSKEPEDAVILEELYQFDEKAKREEGGE